MKLRIKFILFFAGLAVLLIGGLTVYLNSYFKNYFKNYTLNNFQILAELSESSYFSFIRSLEIRTVDWSSDGYIRTAVEEILKTQVQNREPLVKALNSYLKNEKIIYDPEVIIIDILDQDGIVLASSRDERIGVNEKKEELELGNVRFIEAAKANFGQTFTAPVVIEEDEHTDPMIHLTTRIFSKKTYIDGLPIPLNAVFMLHFVNTIRLRDVLIGSPRLEEGRMANMALTDYYKTADIYLVNKDRLIITPLRFNEKTVLKQKVETEPVKACFERGEEIKTEYFNYRGQSVFGSSMCFKKEGVALILEVESQEILAPLKKINQFFILIGGIIIILIIAGIALLSGWLLKGLSVIVEVAKKISKNNFSARTNIKSKDEIGTLGKVFNEMLDSIEKGQKELKEKDVKIEEKLAELEKFTNLVIGRELKMLELKKEIAELQQTRDKNQKRSGKEQSH